MIYQFKVESKNDAQALQNKLLHSMSQLPKELKVILIGCPKNSALTDSFIEEYKFLLDWDIKIRKHLRHFKSIELCDENGNSI